MEITRDKRKAFKEFEEKVKRLLEAERQLNALNAPAAVFGVELKSIRAKLKSPSKVEEVEQEIRVLREKVAEYNRAAEQALQAERKGGEEVVPVSPPSKPAVGGEEVVPVSPPSKPAVGGEEVVPVSPPSKPAVWGTPIDVFICYAEEDADIALEIALGLEEAGYATWCYELDTIPGLSYLVQTKQAIERSEALVVVISPHSLSSHQITKEIIRAHESGKHFFPCLRDITQVEFQNRQPEWREAIGAATSVRIPPEGAVGIIARIVSGLKALDIHPRLEPEAARIAGIRKALDAQQQRSMSG